MFDIDDVIEYNEKQYIILDKINEGKMYFLVNQINEEEEPTDNFEIIEFYDDEYYILRDENKMNSLLNIFEKNIQENN